MNIFQDKRKPDYWRLKVWFGELPDGKPKAWTKYVTVHGRKAAETAWRRFEYEVCNGLLEEKQVKAETTEPINQTLFEYIKLEIETDTLARRTRWSYLQKLAHLESIHDRKLVSMDTRDARAKITDVYSAMREGRKLAGLSGRVYSERTILHVHRLLCKYLNRAVDDELISRNPLKKGDAPKPTDGAEVPVMQLGEIDRLLAEAKNHDFEMELLLYLRTGVRRSELLALTRPDILWDQNRIRIERALDVVPGEPILIKPPKSNKVRYVPVDDELLERLRQYLIKRNEFFLGFKQDEPEYIFTDRRRPFRLRHPDTATKCFERIAKAVGVRATLHGCRHTYGSHMYARGVNPIATSRAMGHSKVSTTQNIYGHTFDADMDDVAAAASEFG